MVTVTPFKAAHIAAITGRPAPEFLGVGEHQVAALEATSWALTIWVDQGPVACCGIVTHWPGRGEAWAVLNAPVCQESQAARRAVLQIARKVMEAYRVQSDGCRLEATVKCDDFEEGHRFVKHLGFRLEGPRLRKYRPDGHDVSLYAWVR